MFQLTLTAEGYAPIERRFTLRDGEPWAVLELDLDPVEAEGAATPTSTRGRIPLPLRGPGLVSYWGGFAEFDGVNTKVCRGAPVTAGGASFGHATVDEHGDFLLDGPWHQYALCFQAPGQPARWLLPTGHADATHAPIPSGTVSGRIRNATPNEAPFVYVVLFSDGFLQVTARARADGSFTLSNVPVRRYWVRAGDDNFERARSALSDKLGLADYRASARAWVDATEVQVVEDQTTYVDVDLP